MCCKYMCICIYVHMYVCMYTCKYILVKVILELRGGGRTNSKIHLSYTFLQVTF